MKETDFGCVENLSLCVIEVSVIESYSALQKRLVRSKGIARIEPYEVWKVPMQVVWIILLNFPFYLNSVSFLRLIKVDTNLEVGPRSQCGYLCPSSSVSTSPLASMSDMTCRIWMQRLHLLRKRSLCHLLHQIPSRLCWKAAIWVAENVHMLAWSGIVNSVVCVVYWTYQK